MDGCTLVTAAELSQAAGVQYTDSRFRWIVLQRDRRQCDNLFFIVDKEGAPPNTWDAQVAVLKRDDELGDQRLGRR